MAILVTVTHIQSSFYTLVTCIRLGTADTAEITTQNLHSSPPGYVLELETKVHPKVCNHREGLY